MADNPRSTTPAWQDPHLKDRGDYTEQDIQNIRGKGGILPDFTLDEAEETYLFARVAQALSKTLTRQGLTVGHEAKAAAEPMGFRLDEHAIAIDTRRPWKDIALDLAHALGTVQVARDALNPADQPQGAAEWNRYKDKGRMVVYGQINVYGVTTKSERHKRSYWTRTADGNGIGGRKAPVPYGS